MANRYAIASGNYSNPAIWDGGLGVPTSADVVRPSGFVIDVDGNFTANQFRNDASTPALANGRFNLLNGSSLTGLNTTAFSYVTSGAGFITFSLAVGNSATLNGNINFSNRISSNPLTHSGGGTLTINGNVTSTGASLSGVGGAIWFSGSGNLNINGNVTGGGNNGGSPSDLISHAGAGTINVVGNVASGAFTGWNDRVFILTGTGNLNITGNVTGVNSGSPAALSSPAIQHSGSGTVCVIGNVYGGTSTNGNAIYSPGNNVTKVIGNLYGSGAQAFIGVHPMAKLVLHGVSYQTDLGVGGYGNILIHPTNEIFQEFRTSLSGTVDVARRLYSGGTTLGQPTVNNVRYGTVYGVSSEYTGTCRVPSAAYVSAGVLVDNTIGTLEFDFPTLEEIQTTVENAVADVITLTGSNTVTARIIDDYTDAVTNYRFTVLNSVGASIGDITTDTNGDVEFPLNNGSYYLRFPISHLFDTHDDVAFTVSGDTTIPTVTLKKKFYPA